MPSKPKPTDPPEPQDGLERKASWLTKILEIIFGKGSVNWPRAAIAIVVIVSALVYFLATHFAPSAFAMDDLNARLAKLETMAIDPNDLKRLVFEVGDTKQGVARLECQSVGGSYQTCLSRYPPLTPPQP